MNEYFVLRKDKEKDKKKKKTEKKSESKESGGGELLFFKVLLHYCFLFGDHCKNVRTIDYCGQFNKGRGKCERNSKAHYSESWNN